MKLYKALLFILFLHATCYGQSQWEQIGSTIYGTSDDNQLGHSVSLNSDGDIMAIGSPDLADGNGIVKVFRFIGGDWIQHGTTISGTFDQRFGYRVSLNASGNILAIGAPKHNQDNEGYVRVYTYNGTDWIPLGTSIEIPLNDGNDKFGHSVSLSSDGYTVAVGAPRDGEQVGYVKVYTYNGTDWIQLGPDIVGIDYGRSGFSVKLSDNGETIVIGAPSANIGTSVSDGLVRIYKYINPSWVQLGTDLGQVEFEDFGISVDISSDGNIIAASGLLYDVVTDDYTQFRQVYEYNGNDWMQLGSDLISSGSFNTLGYALSLSDDGLTIAYTGSNTLLGEPKVEVMSYNGTDWAIVGDEITGNLGGTVCLNAQGNRVVSGNFYADNFAGHVSAFEYSENIGVAENIQVNLVYPNPVKDFLHIESTDKTKYNLYSILGQEAILSGDLQKGVNKLDLSYLKKGVYVLQIISNEGISTTKKVIKQN